MLETKSKILTTGNHEGVDYAVLDIRDDMPVLRELSELDQLVASRHTDFYMRKERNLKAYLVNQFVEMKEGRQYNCQYSRSETLLLVYVKEIPAEQTQAEQEIIETRKQEQEQTNENTEN